MTSDDDVRVMIREYTKDLVAFNKAKVILQSRISDLEGEAHFDHFVNWAGTQAAMNVLIMCESRCQGIVDDLKDNIKQPGTVIHLLPKEKDQNEQPD